MKEKQLTLKLLNGRINKLLREVRDLRNTMFRWGQQNMKDIDELKSKLKETEKNIFVKNNMIDLIPIAKEMETTELIQKEKQDYENTENKLIQDEIDWEKEIANDEGILKERK